MLPIYRGSIWVMLWVLCECCGLSVGAYIYICMNVCVFICVCI